METFSALLALFAGNSLVTREFPHKSQWRGALMFSLICAWINGYINKRTVGDLRRHRAHYDVIVMWTVKYPAVISTIHRNPRTHTTPLPPPHKLIKSPLDLGHRLTMTSTTLCDVINHSRSNFNVDLAKPPMNFRHERVIISPKKLFPILILVKPW